MFCFFHCLCVVGIDVQRSFIPRYATSYSRGCSPGPSTREEGLAEEEEEEMNKVHTQNTSNLHVMSCHV